MNLSVAELRQLRNIHRDVSKRLEMRNVDPGRNHRKVAPRDAPFVSPLNWFEKIQVVTCFGNKQAAARLNNAVSVNSYFKTTVDWISRLPVVSL